MTLVEMLNPFTGKQAGDAPDEIQRVDPAADKTIELVLEALERYRTMIPEDGDGEYRQQCAINVNPPLLTPGQLNTLLSSSRAYGWKDMIFMSRVMEMTHNRYGPLSFALPSMDFLGYMLKGTEKRPVQLTLHGDAGSYCLRGAQYCQLKVYGNGRFNFGVNAKHCRFELLGDMGAYCTNLTEVRLVIHGNANQIGPKLDRCRVYIKGDVGRIENPITNNLFMIGGTLKEPPHLSNDRIWWNDNRFLTPNHGTYDVLRAAGVPDKDVTLLDRMPTPEEVFQ